MILKSTATKRPNLFMYSNEDSLRLAMPVRMTTAPHHITPNAYSEIHILMFLCELNKHIHTIMHVVRLH